MDGWIDRQTDRQTDTCVYKNQVQDLSVPGATPPQSGPGSPEQKQVGSLGRFVIFLEGFLRSFFLSFGLLMSIHIHLQIHIHIHIHIQIHKHMQIHLHIPRTSRTFEMVGPF